MVSEDGVQGDGRFLQLFFQRLNSLFISLDQVAFLLKLLELFDVALHGLLCLRVGFFQLSFKLVCYCEQLLLSHVLIDDNFFIGSSLCCSSLSHAFSLLCTKAS